MDEIKAMGISEDLIKSCWCADCLNVKNLPNCPKGCNGGVEEQKGNPNGYVKDETVEVEI